MFKPLAVLTIVVGRVEPEAGERLVSEPDCEGAAGDDVVEDLPSLGSAVLLEEVPLFDRALDAIVERLRQAHPAGEKSPEKAG